MALTAQEQFQTLLQQLQYEEVPASLQQTALTKLAVHKQSKVWQFHLEMPALPPVQDMAALVARMQTAFANIAQTTYQLPNKSLIIGRGCCSNIKMNRVLSVRRLPMCCHKSLTTNCV